MAKTKFFITPGWLYRNKIRKRKYQKYLTYNVKVFPETKTFEDIKDSLHEFF